MSGKWKPWRTAAEQVLADGEWHRIEEVADAMRPMIPAPIAVRHREGQIASKRKAKRTQAPRQATADAMVQAGRTHMVAQTIHNTVRRGTWERDGDRIRLRPS